jgi:hypothetical protein
MSKVIPLFLLLFSCGLFAQEDLKRIAHFKIIEDRTSMPDSKPEDYAGYPELKRWALFEGLYLQPDSSIGGVRDGECRMISAEGLTFYLEVDKELSRKLYLYLDFTTYEARANKKYPIRTLQILVKNKHRKTIQFNPAKVEENPVRLELDRSDLENGRINIKLLPDIIEGGRFWGIWDAFYSFEKEKE